MITFWEIENNVSKIDSFKPGCWVNVKVPNQEEIDYLKSSLNIPEDFIHDVLDIDEVPRIETNDENSYVILRVPLSNPNNGVPYVTVPLGDCDNTKCNRYNLFSAKRGHIPIV